LFKYERDLLEKRAKNLNFIKDTYEKVYRLSDILSDMNANELYRDSLALKGGTAINLTVFNMPRLSVDIDFDFILPVSRDEMIAKRELINQSLIKYMLANDYYLSDKTKNPHTLDSWVFYYINTSGNRDNIKIEINYSNRVHIQEITQREITTDALSSRYKVTTIGKIELFGSKLAALVGRTAARDLYDISNMVYYGIIDGEDYDLLRKCFVFYYTLSAQTIDMQGDIENINSITMRKIKTDLYPVISTKEKFDLEATKKRVYDFAKELISLSKDEVEYVKCFENKEYRPELLFRDVEIVERIKDHPMALWKMRK